MAETEQKKDETDKTEAETEKTADSKSSVGMKYVASPYNMSINVPWTLNSRETQHTAQVIASQVPGLSLPRASFQGRAEKREYTDWTKLIASTWSALPEIAVLIAKLLWRTLVPRGILSFPEVTSRDDGPSEREETQILFRK